MPKWTVLKTSQGKILNNQVISGTADSPLRITRIVASRKGGMSTSQLLSATKETLLSSDRYAQDLQIVDVLGTNKVPPFTEEQAVIVGQLRNDRSDSYMSGTTTWDLCQIGVFAKASDGNEVLFLIAQDSEPDTIPIKSDNIIISNYSFNLLSSEDLQIESTLLNAGGLVTAEVFSALKDRVFAVEEDYLSKTVGGSVLGSVDLCENLTTQNISGKLLANGVYPIISGFSEIDSEVFKENGVKLEDKYYYIKKITTSVDFNDYHGKEYNGIYEICATPTNLPSVGGWGTLFVHYHSSTQRTVQIYYPGKYDYPYLRYYSDDTWSTWKRQCDGGNADTVNGKHAEDFLSSTGGEVNGAVTVSPTVKVSNKASSSTVDYTVNNWTYTGGVGKFVIAEVEKETNEYIRDILSLYSSSDELTTPLKFKADKFIGDGSGLTNVNADTVGNKTVEELQNYNNLTNKPDLNFVKLNESGKLVVATGIYNNVRPADVGLSDLTTASYCSVIVTEPDTDGCSSYIALSKSLNEIFIKNSYSGVWKKLSLDGHTHTKNDITNFPTSLPANGGNADTVGNKSADEFALADHTHDEYLEKNATISISQGGTGATTASSARSNLGLGTSATKGYTTAVTSGSTNLVTSGAVYTELQKYLKSDGDGSDVTNVNAVKVGGKSVGDLLAKTNRYLAVEDTDLNTITDMGVYTIGTEDGTEMSDSKNQPAGAYQWGTLAVFASGSYGLTQVYYTHTGDTYVRGLYGDVNWNPWKKCGENANSVNKIAKNFTVKKGSWFRFAKCKNALASGVFVLAVNSNNGHSSISTFSVSQAYSVVNTGQTKITELSHSSFNGCVTKVRLDTKYGDNVEQYIDFYLGDGSDNSTGNVTVQFFGQGWEICDIESNNVITDYTTQEITL